MKLSIRGVALSLAILWGAAVLLAGLAHLKTGYGAALLELLASIYPGYKASGAIGDVVVGALYAAVDGAVFGLLFAWLYNRFVGEPPAEKPDRLQEKRSPIEPEA